MKRRAAAARGAAPRRRAAPASPPRVAVVGAGAFGGWTALELQRRGARVTLVDAWGAGNPRSSSAGETRVIRALYGGDAMATRMSMRALALWTREEERLGETLTRRTGVLWIAGEDDRILRRSVPVLRRAGARLDEIPPADARRRWPLIDFAGARRIALEPEAGILYARRACGAVLRAFLGEGGRYVQAAARAPFRPEMAEAAGRGARRAVLASVLLSTGERLDADRFVFACGPWLGSLFPDVVGGRIRPTRQEVFTFAPPAEDAGYGEDRLPILLDFGPPLLYAIPAGAGRGVKVADDTRGGAIDPSTDRRVASAEGVRAARAWMARRLPGLSRAPVQEATVCQYEDTADGRFVIDRHPAAGNVFIAGGGSGHGFKHGPAVGEILADIVLAGRRPPSAFRLGRLRG